MKVKFKEKEYIAVGTYYNGDDNKAITLIDSKSKQPIATATINMPDMRLPANTVFIKDYSENTGMVKALVEAGIIHDKVMYTLQSTFVNVSAYSLTNKAINKLWE